jgi:hypothetical protein
MVVVDDNSNIKWKKIKLLNATTFQGRIRDFKITPKNHIFSNCGGRREHFWGISCEKLLLNVNNFFQFKSRLTLF